MYAAKHLMILFCQNIINNYIKLFLCTCIMLRKINIFIFFLFAVPGIINQVAGQVQAADSLRILSYIDSAEYYTYINTDRSINYGKQALQASQKEHFLTGEAEALLSLARASYIKGQYDLSLRYSSGLSGLSRKIGFRKGIAFALNNSGLIFLSRENYKAALNEFNQALAANKALGNLKAQGANHFNIGLCYIGLNDLQAAEEVLHKSISFSKEAKDTTVLLMAINRLGDIACQRGSYALALQYFNSAIQQNTIKNDWEQAFSYTGMAIAYLGRNQFRDAIEVAEKGLNYAKKINAFWDIQRATSVLHQAYAERGDYKKAYEYHLLDKIYSDSLHNEKKDREISTLLLKQKQIENDELQHLVKIKQQRNQVNQLIILVVGCIIAFLAIILILIYRNHKKVRKLNNDLMVINGKLSGLNHSKDQLFSVIGHDMRSPIVSIIQTVNMLRSNSLSAQETQIALDNFFEKLTATATMLDNLLLWVNNQKTALSTEPVSFNLAQLVEQLLLALNFQAKEKSIRIHHQADGDTQVFADVNHTRIILQNILSNALKFTKTGGGIFMHYFSAEEDGRRGIVIRDTGVGIPEEKLNKLFQVMGKDISTYGTANEKGIGIGLMLVKKYADENQVEIIVNSSEKGTEFVLVFPLPGLK